VSLLPAKTLDLTDREPLHADGAQGLLHFVELERLDDRFNLLHRFLLTDASRSSIPTPLKL
jgi:hypothetical protein